MKKLPWVLLGVIIGCASTRLLLRSETALLNRTPPFRPFEVNAHINLESLVEHGYRFSDAPCGMVHFAKMVGDTMERYYVDVRCPERIEPDVSDDFLAVPAGLDEQEIPTVPHFPTADELLLERRTFLNQSSRSNAYWPFSEDSIAQCEQHISWRTFDFVMQDFDPEALLTYINQQGCAVVDTPLLDPQRGADLWVLNTYSKMVFRCSVARWPDVENPPYWMFSLQSEVPNIAQEKAQALN